MRYRANERRRASEYEKAIAEWWKKNRTFEKSVEERPIDKSYVFYDGPPFITGMPHFGTLLSSIVKDAVPRFWTMNGFRVERRWGWDCHGLPAENFVEKQLGIMDRREIGTKWPLETYINKARESMVANSELWRGTIDRVGRWVDFDHAYRTMDKDYMESVWWAFKQLYEAGMIYEGRKVLMYDTKFATPVSKAEVTMDNDAYKVVTDPSVYVKFKLVDRDAYLLAWTTTPWTLPGNMAIVVNPKLKYGQFEVEGEHFIVCLSRAKALFGDNVKKEAEFAGKDLIGLKYEPIFELPKNVFESGASEKAGMRVREENENSDQKDKNFGFKSETYTVLGGDYVTDEDGTGLVHTAPAYGEDDFRICNEHEVDFADVLDENGYYLPEVAEKLHEIGVRDTDESGIQVWAANKIIAKCLLEKGIVWKIEYIQHEYPFNPRSKERIMYRAFPSWFFDIADHKAVMLEENENINWFPKHLKHGRFAKNIEQAPDWNLSRDRFWATAMPVWKGDKGSVKVVGSYDELFELSGVRLDDYHRPWVDEIEFDFNGEHFKRISKVLDCWFESGSMPFAELHYPFENKEKFEKNYPADFIVEYIGQVRAWFYYVHAVNTALAKIGAFGEKAKTGHKNAFKNVITTGTLAGNDGRKMSKSLGNFTDPNVLMDQYSADALRFLLLSSPVLAGEDFSLIDKDVSDTQRRLAMIWNTFDFFTTYAEAAGIDSEILARRVFPEDDFSNGVRSAEELNKFATGLENVLDKWIVARIFQVRNQITDGMLEYNIPAALAPVLPFLDDLSNWFVRRSRKRFVTEGKDRDEAFATLYFVLVYLAEILAPFVPFLAEELYQKMTGENSSVHLLLWPEAGEIDAEVISKMGRVRTIINEGLAMRMNKSETEKQIKVRQPLSKFMYAGEKLAPEYEQMMIEELNVKSVMNGEKTWLDKEITPELAREGEVRELIRAVQTLRKKSGMKIDDEIKVSVSDEIPEQYREEFLKAVRAEEVSRDENYKFDQIVKINDRNVVISIEKK